MDLTTAEARAETAGNVLRRHPEDARVEPRDSATATNVTRPVSSGAAPTRRDAPPKQMPERQVPTSNPPNASGALGPRGAADPVGDKVQQRSLPGRAWWPCRLELATPGFVVVLVEVTWLARVLEAAFACDCYEMSLEDLMAVVLEPFTIDPRPVAISCPLSNAAASAGLTPWGFVAWRLVLSSRNRTGSTAR